MTVLCGSRRPIRVSIALITDSLLLTTCCICAFSRAFWQASRRSSRRFVFQAKNAANNSVTIMPAPCFSRNRNNQVSAIVFISVMPGGGVNGVSSTAVCALWGEVNGLDYSFLGFFVFFFAGVCLSGCVFTGAGLVVFLPGMPVSIIRPASR